MDDLVKAALKKWPNVPACYDWLALDARGGWYMRDDRVQAQGRFPAVKGSRIEHDKLLEFIGRNYGVDEQGAWFFQNGPQRVYVALEAAPWVWRIAGAEAAVADAADGVGPAITSHTGVSAAYRSGWLDELGRLFLATDQGLGIVHTLDMEAASAAIEAGLWSIEEAPFASLPERFGYVLAPAKAA
ncbi:MAG: hypothetical protein JWQ11_4346 [Rhizobacter sp.]|nr:hypothetical protein [Rhizobacter sp.]